MPSTTAPLTWPTSAELDSIGDCMGGEEGALARIMSLQEELDRRVNLDVSPSIEEVREAIERGSEPLTLENVGAVASCLARLRLDLEFALGSVRAMETQRDAMALEVVTPKGGDDA